MQKLIDTVNHWSKQNKAVAIATVIKTWGSAPRKVGAQMAVNIDGEMVGSVSGGCVESAVVDAGIKVIQTGHPQYLNFDVVDEIAWEIGLSCGGKIDIFVRPLHERVFGAIQTAWKKEQKLVIATVIQGPKKIIGKDKVLLDKEEIVSSFDIKLNEQLLEKFNQAFTSGSSKLVTGDEDFSIFLNHIRPSHTLIIIGGVHIAVALVSIAKTLGFRTIVIDPRAAFANHIRFEHADDVLPMWPNEALVNLSITESTAIAVLTHDPKIDDQALEIALKSPAFYVGALGSHNTQTQRRQRLSSAGLSKEQLDRLYAPIGLDLGGRSPEQISLAIMAEIVKVINQK